MYTISVLAHTFGLSRSALIYYDKIGLLSPSSRSGSAYRLYSEADKARLRQICGLRAAGIPLEQIADLLAAQASSQPQRAAHVALIEHLQALSQQIQALRAQQARVVKLIFSTPIQQGARALDRDQLVSLLCAAGMQAADLQQLHAHFESTNPEEHRRFLADLGMPAEDIAALRASTVAPHA